MYIILLHLRGASCGIKNYNTLRALMHTHKNTHTQTTFPQYVVSVCFLILYKYCSLDFRNIVAFTKFLLQNYLFYFELVTFRADNGQ